MSTTIAGNSASYPTSITVPSDGDDKAAASVDVPFQGLADRTAFLGAQVYGVKADDRLPIPLTPVVNASSRFEFLTAFPETGASGATAGWLQYDVTDKGCIAFPLDNLPKRGKITGIIATLKGGVGHTALPAAGHLPAIQLWAQDPDDPTSSPTRIATKNDSSADIASYEATHTLDMIGLAELFENTIQNRYYVAFYGEDGPDAKVNCTLVGITVVVAPEV